MKLKRRTVKRGRIEIIPMIDTILILLIFFMSFSTFSKKEKRMDAKLPVVAPPNPNAPILPVLDIILRVKDANHILVNGREYDLPTLRGAMKTMSDVGTKATIVIEAEADTQYQAVIGALDACAGADLTKVAFRPLADKAAATTP